MHGPAPVQKRSETSPVWAWTGLIQAETGPVQTVIITIQQSGWLCWWSGGGAFYHSEDMSTANAGAQGVIVRLKEEGRPSRWLP